VTALSDTQLSSLQRELALPDLGDRYRLTARLGRGGMGAVYLGHDTLLNRDVAVKVVEGDSGSAAFAKHLAGEAQILARLEHPGIVPVHDFGRSPEGLDYYVMKHVEGETFARYCTRATTLVERLRALRRVCETIAFAHAQGVVHGDLSPRNVMVGAYGEVLTLDWGLARTAAAQSEGTEGSPAAASDATSPDAPARRIGTPGYAAPELTHASAPITSAADVYALGGLLLLACTGAHPTEAAPRMSAGDRDRAPLLAMCTRARADDPRDRYESGAAFAADLARYLDHDRVQAYREPWAESLLRLGRKYQVVIALVGAYLLMRVLVAWWTARG